jgi:hypothetical protein
MSRPPEAAPALIYKEDEEIILDGETFDTSTVTGEVVRLGDENSAVYLGDTYAAGNNTALYVEDAIYYIQMYADPAGSGYAEITLDGSDDSGFIDINVAGGGTIRLGNTTQKLVFRGLPTANPNNAGQVWNDSGTLKVSAG